MWDGVLRLSGAAGLVAIPVTFLWPTAAAFTGFVLATFWLNGPLAPFFPATYEVMLVPLGRLYPPWGIAGAGMACIVGVEYVNFHLYGRFAKASALKRVREGRVARLVLAWFRAAPFWAVWVCAWSPLPYWVVRLAAPVAGYPIGRYLAATILGRFPRLWVFATIGRMWTADPALLWFGAAALALTLPLMYAFIRGVWQDPCGGADRRAT